MHDEFVKTQVVLPKKVDRMLKMIMRAMSPEHAALSARRAKSAKKMNKEMSSW